MHTSGAPPIDERPGSPVSNERTLRRASESTSRVQLRKGKLQPPRTWFNDVKMESRASREDGALAGERLERCRVRLSTFGLIRDVHDVPTSGQVRGTTELALLQVLDDVGSWVVSTP